jgi:PAS domain S-box-containing protein
MGILSALILATLVWVGVLRSQVTKQTAALRESVHREARLKDSYQELFENANDIVYTHDVAGKITSVNRAAEKISGYTREELLTMDIAQIVAPEHLFTAREMLERKLAGGGPTAYEIEITAKDGRRVPMEVSTRLICENGKPVGVHGIGRDITERRGAEEALRQAEQKYRSILENAVEGIFQSTPDGRRISANPGLARMFGYESPEELMSSLTDIGRQLYVDPQRRILFKDLLEKQGELRGFESQVYRKDGSIIWISENVRSVRNESGKVVYYEGMVHDITDRKRAEEALGNLHRRLLQFQDEERRRIARDLHDTTAQNLAALVMNLGAVARSVDDLSPRARSAFSESLALAKQASQEIRTLSYLLHPPMLDEFGLGPTLRGYVEGFGRRSGIQVLLDMSPHIGRLSPESEITVFRIVQESLANIYQHSGSKSAQIRIDRNANAIKVEIEDHGRGMAVRTLKKIEKGGAAILGVGIPGMRERVKHLGGELTIQAGKGGTTVTAVLPLNKTKS